jgi:DNA primase
VLKAREQLNQIKNRMMEAPDQEDYKTYFSTLRQLKRETIVQADGFMVDEDLPVSFLPEQLQHESLGFCKESHFTFSGRFIFPVKDPNGDVMGFLGYDKFEEPKYLDSRNQGYKAKHTTFMGMEKLRDYYQSDHVIFVEGVICMLWLRENGFNAFASLGAYMNPYLVKVAARFKDRAIFIPDGDETGGKYGRNVRRYLPMAKVVRPKIKKDVDDTRLEFGTEIVKEDLNKIIRNGNSVGSSFFQ